LFAFAFAAWFAFVFAVWFAFAFAAWFAFAFAAWFVFAFAARFAFAFAAWFRVCVCRLVSRLCLPLGWQSVFLSATLLFQTQIKNCHSLLFPFLKTKPRIPCLARRFLIENKKRKKEKEKKSEKKMKRKGGCQKFHFFSERTFACFGNFGLATGNLSKQAIVLL